ncbi:hypothetical protein [Enterococcus sp. AZ109]|uniref:hypothetical protein n=1 Tax=Enterococcus sp. AZ109 TaxID=2774634 RepID=UPI003F2926D9
MKTENLSLTNDELYEKAVVLTATVNRIRIVERLIENFEYARVRGDVSLVQFQINNGVFSDIGDSLSDIKDVIQNVSDRICPTAKLLIENPESLEEAK